MNAPEILDHGLGADDFPQLSMDSRPAAEHHFGSFNKEPQAAMEAILELITAITKAQSEFDQVQQNCTARVKPKDTTRGEFEFKYADYHAYREASKKQLAQQGLMTSFMPTSHSGSQYLRMYVIHTRGGYLMVEAEVPAIPGGSLMSMLQGWGGSLSLLRRYLYRSALDMSEREERGDDVEPMDEMTASMRSRQASVAQAAAYPKHPSISAAKSLSELSKFMTSLPKADKGKYSTHYEAKLMELRSHTGADDGLQDHPE